MREIPLFPLNTVLFPGTPITLHIFEPRYKRMFNYCIDNQEPFGVVLIRHGQEANGPLAEPYDVGCSARITYVEKLKDDRMNVIGIGEDRFRILNMGEYDEYLLAEVEPWPLANEPSAELRPANRQLRAWVQRYLQIMVEHNLVNSSLEELPNDPLDLAYLAAYLLQTPSKQKQSLLEADHGSLLIAQITSIYRKEVALLSNLVQGEGAHKASDRSTLN